MACADRRPMFPVVHWMTRSRRSNCGGAMSARVERVLSRLQLLCEEVEDGVDELLLPVQCGGGVLHPGHLHLDEVVAKLLRQGVESRANGSVAGEAGAEDGAAMGSPILDRGEVRG